MNTLWIFPECIHRITVVFSLVLVWPLFQQPLLGQFGSDVQYFSQVVLNDGSTTSFTINNPSITETISVAAQVYSTAGQPLADGQVELGPGATATLDFGDPQADLTTGWAELSSDDDFIATEFFQLSIAGELKPRVGVLPSVPSDAARFLGFVNPQFKSGLAVTNPSATDATEVTIRAKDNSGQEPVVAKILMLEPLQSVVGFLNEEKFFGTELNNYEGVVELSVNSPGVAALSLIQEVATGDVATVSVLTQSHIIADTSSGETAVGVGALVSNTTGSDNTAIGINALEANTTGGFNTASGSHALQSNTSGFHNTASGYHALQANTTGLNNTATGYRALRANTTGGGNTASGISALQSNVGGSNNIAIGSFSGMDLVNGSHNIYVGNPGAEESNTIRIGSAENHNNAFIAGVQVVPVSSRQFKREIQDMDQASRDLMRLRPVTFRYKTQHELGDGRRQFGLIAEEVAQIYPELVVNDDAGQPKTVEYQKLPAMLLNELQRQHQEIQEQRDVVRGQATAILKLNDRLTQLEQVLTAQSALASAAQ